MNIFIAILLGLLAVFFALAAPADSTPGRPLYPTGDSQVGVLMALVAVLLAFCAGVQL